mgnify:CR=1 FL=1
MSACGDRNFISTLMFEQHDDSDRQQTHTHRQGHRHRQYVPQRWKKNSGAHATATRYFTIWSPQQLHQIPTAVSKNLKPKTQTPNTKHKNQINVRQAKSIMPSKAVSRVPILTRRRRIPLCVGAIVPNFSQVHWEVVVADVASGVLER